MVKSKGARDFKFTIVRIAREIRLKNENSNLSFSHYSDFLSKCLKRDFFENIDFD